MKALIISILVIGLLVATASFVNAANRKKKGAAGILNVVADPIVFPLQKGSRGKAVQIMQAYSGDTKVDGIFGEDTARAMRGLYTDGNGIITKERFVQAVFAGYDNGQRDTVFPLRLGSELSFAHDVLQIMLGVPLNPFKVIDTRTMMQVGYAFGDASKQEVTLEDYKALLKAVFSLTDNDLA